MIDRLPFFAFQLNPWEERTATAQQVVQRLRQKVGAVPGIKFFMQIPQNITVGGCRKARSSGQATGSM
jgi:HAE1 family hydrophobic/amphiphilic exporter-1